MVHVQSKLFERLDTEEWRVGVLLLICKCDLGFEGSDWAIALNMRESPDLHFEGRVYKVALLAVI